MSIREFLKPSIFKLLAFLFIGIFYIYFAKEDVCGVGLFFAFCYNSYGFPFSYLVTGNVDTAFGHIKTLFLGNFFAKYRNFLFNPAAFLLDIALIYLLSCFIAMLFKNMKVKNKSN